jgi:hypothetical protein
MEAIYSSETLVSTYKSTRPRNLQNHHANLHGYENLKSLSITFSNRKFVTIPCAFQTIVLFAMPQKKKTFLRFPNWVKFPWQIRLWYSRYVTVNCKHNSVSIALSHERHPSAELKRLVTFHSKLFHNSTVQIMKTDFFNKWRVTLNEIHRDKRLYHPLWCVV